MILFLAIAFSIPVLAAPIESWFGRVTIGGGQYNDTAIVEAFISGTKITNVTAGLYISGYYLIDVECAQGDNVTLKIYGISALPSQTCLPNDGARQEFNLTVNKSADGASCTYAAGCSGGYCNSNVCASSVPSTTTTTTGGGSGGGGAAVAVEGTKTISTATAGTTASVEISKTTSDTVAVTKIEIEVANTVTNVQITVKESSKPAGVLPPVQADTGAVYKYIEIKKANIQDADISKAKVKFKVTKTRLTANKINENTVALNRFINNGWTKLSTKKISETTTEIEYEAETQGFSTFAITGEKITTTICGNNIKESGEECDGSVTETCVTKGYASGTLSCSNCKFDVSACVSAAATSICGNNIKESGEECDGSVTETCVTKGYDSGTLKCSSCKFDASACKSAAMLPFLQPGQFDIIIYVIIAIVLIAVIFAALKFKNIGKLKKKIR